PILVSGIPALSHGRRRSASSENNMLAWRCRAEVAQAVVTSFILLWLAGAALRLTILGVPPIIPLIRADLKLSETQVGILSVLPLVDGSWRLDLVAWAVPVAMIALAVVALSPRSSDPSRPARAHGQRWWPDWRSGLIWRPGLMFGMATSMYFGANAFVPDYLS